MKLSELVKIKKNLEAIVLSDYELPLNQQLKGLREQFANKDKLSIDLQSAISSSQENINLEFAKIRQNIQDYKNYICSLIAEQEPEIYQISDDVYRGGLHDDAEYILARRRESLTLKHEENRDLFFGRLGMYNSWKYPAIELRPATGEVTNVLKGCDPLYLVDTNEKLFSHVKTLWNTAYQNRLRYYTINEAIENPFKDLTDNQFGLIASVDYFNFKPIELIERFLQDFYTKLRPGGIAMFTYNNCDLPYAVRNVENRFCCYTPGHKVKDIALNIGFEIVKSFDQLENVSWLELRKPGEITTLRGGQTLGEIHSFD